jgi:hypothetical protein
MFTTEAKQFIIKAVRVRMALIYADKSHKEYSEMVYLCTWFRRHLHAYDFTELNMSSFLFRHYTEIQSILPGEGSKCYSRFQSEFKNIMDKALDINNKKIENLITKTS